MRGRRERGEYLVSLDGRRGQGGCNAVINLKQRQGILALGSSQPQEVAVQRQGVGPGHLEAETLPPALSLRGREGPGDQTPTPLAVLARQLQICAGQDVHVAHAAPHGHVGTPFLGIVAEEVTDFRVQAVEGFQPRVGVGAGEG